ncbi:glycosyltransferase family 4 protein [Aurantimicrobium minutum]|uniref:Glycosyltransferase n=1 Tax=Aurantimicrobium minutum TaxID=708131 RepID=A0A173LV72_9MICO|nr:glycosyltransferase family 4 protein [Aurantimicrobium minutum]BAU98730.1 glycosyltransferase [Aurantimicrobium minutum]
MGKKRVLIITGDPIGASMAGPAIRAWHMAYSLTQAGNSVRLLSCTSVEKIEVPFGLEYVAFGDDESFKVHEQWAEVIIFQGHALLVFEVLRKSNKILVADIYDPMHLEQLEQAKNLPTEKWVERVKSETDVLNDQLLRGDFFICASERQRDFWLGQLAALGRLNPYVYKKDNSLDSLIAVVPFGLSEVEPIHTRNVMKGVIPGIGINDQVILWSGGLYDWFDPQTLIKSVAQLSKKYPTVKLFFQGTKHPNPHVTEMDIVKTSKELAGSLGVLDTNVFFNDSWVPFSERSNFLLEADIGVSTHHLHVETAFSFRTRILDYLWARLPMVVTRGDFFANLVELKQLGITVEDKDTSDLTIALEKILFDKELHSKFRSNIEKVRAEFYWNTVFSPLVDFVNNACHASDNEIWIKEGRNFEFQAEQLKQPVGFKYLVTAAIHTYKKEGLTGLFSKISRFVNRKN